MSRILWAFNVELALDKQGKLIIPDQEKLTQGFVCMPEEFPAKITPRSRERADIVVNEWKAAEMECLDPETKQWKIDPTQG